MRATLNVLTDELRRLKASGVRSVAVSEASLDALRRAVKAQGRNLATSPIPAERVEAIVQAKPIVVAPAPKPTAPKVPSLPPAPPVPALSGSKQERWDQLKAHVINDPVCKARVRPGKKVVLGVGNLEADILFVGEAPGAEEEIQGEPFVGPAGQLLNKMIGAMGLSREKVYIGNIMNWRPDLPVAGEGEQVGNRPPTEEEMTYCLPYLKAQIEVVAPKVLVALGSTAAQGLLGFGSFKALGDVRGRWRDFCGLPLMITYHPSYILRNQSNRSKRMIWEDLLKVMEKVSMPISDKQKGYFLEK